MQLAPLARTIGGVVHPDDEPYARILELCAAARRRLGLPSYSRADIERLFAVKDAPAPPEDLPPNVIRFPQGRRARARRR